MASLELPAKSVGWAVKGFSSSRIWCPATSAGRQNISNSSNLESWWEFCWFDGKFFGRFFLSKSPIDLVVEISSRFRHDLQFFFGEVHLIQGFLGFEVPGELFLSWTRNRNQRNWVGPPTRCSKLGIAPSFLGIRTAWRLPFSILVEKRKRKRSSYIFHFFWNGSLSPWEGVIRYTLQIFLGWKKSLVRIIKIDSSSSEPGPHYATNRAPHCQHKVFPHKLFCHLKWVSLEHIGTTKNASRTTPERWSMLRVVK